VSPVDESSPRLSGRDKALRIVENLKQAGIDLIAALPDAWLTDLIETIAADPAMTLVRVTREDEAVGICAGAYLGGRHAAVLAQNAGVLLSTNVLAGLAMHHQIPVLLLVAQRGAIDDNQYYQVYKGRVTVPVLDAINVPHHEVNRPADYAKIAAAHRQAGLARMPVALLFSRAALVGDE